MQVGQPLPAARSAWWTDVVGVGLSAIGLSLVALSLLMIVAPGVFFNDIAPFGTRNDHYTIDGATFQLALGAGGLVAVSRRSWRIPVLAMLTFQFALHAINHLVDLGEADPKWLGVLDFAWLAAGLALLVFLLILSQRAAQWERSDTPSRARRQEGP